MPPRPPGAGAGGSLRLRVTRRMLSAIVAQPTGRNWVNADRFGGWSEAFSRCCAAAEAAKEPPAPPSVSHSRGRHGLGPGLCRKHLAPCTQQVKEAGAAEGRKLWLEICREQLPALYQRYFHVECHSRSGMSPHHGGRGFEIMTAVVPVPDHQALPALAVGTTAGREVGSG
jgi:hypothetical protein